MVGAAASHGDILTDEQLLAIAVELLVAGHETTVNAIAIASLGLRADPRAAAHLAAAVGDDLAACVEELSRWSSPSQRQRPRWVTRPSHIGDQEVKPGDAVIVMTAAANRDPVQVSEPDEMRFDRNGKRHLTSAADPSFAWARTSPASN